MISVLLAVGPPAGIVCAQGAEAQLPSQRIELPKSTGIADLLELAASEAGVTVEYDAAALRGDTNLRLKEPVTPDELWQLMLGVLERQDLVVIEGELAGTYRVVPLETAATGLGPTIQAGEEPRTLARPFDARVSYVSFMVRVAPGNVETIVGAIKPMLTTNTGIARAMGNEGLIAIADIRRKAEAALEVVRMLDRPGMEPFVLPFKSIPASTASATMQQVLSATSGGKTAGPGIAFIPIPDSNAVFVVAPATQRESIRALANQLDQAETLRTKSYIPPGGVDPDELARAIGEVLELSQPPEGARLSGARAVAEQLTGAVLVRATPAQHERLATFVDNLRGQDLAPRNEFRAFTVRNRDAAELVTTLVELIDANAVLPHEGEAEPLGNSAEESGASPQTSSSQLFRTTDLAPGRQLMLTVDSHTNSILASGTRSRLERLADLVAQLDRRQPQVMLEVTLVSINESRTLDLGVELEGMWRNGRTVTNLASLFGLGGGTAGASAGTGFTGNVIHAGDFEALVRAVESTNAGRAMSMPRLLADNNQPSTLRSVNREPFTAINASDTVATTSFAGNEDAGTTITITPQIAAGDHLTLEYSLELSAFTGDSQTLQGGGVIPPPSQENTLQGKVTIPDSFTVSIGGLRSVNTGDGRTQVPVLGSLPLIGALFGSTSETESEARFYVFLRGTILRDASFAGLRHLSAAELAEAQVNDGTPRVLPVWIE